MEEIDQVHCLATAAEKYDGIVFTDINGKVLLEQFNEDIDEESSIPDNQHICYMEEHTQSTTTRIMKWAIQMITAHSCHWKQRMLAIKWM